MRRRYRFLASFVLFLVLSLVHAQDRPQSPSPDVSHMDDWRPAASDLLESIIADRYETDHIMDLRTRDFDEQKLIPYRTMALTGRFKDADEEFECKYTLFRYALARLIDATDDPNVEREFKQRYISFQDLCRRLYRAHAFADDEQERKAEWVKDPYPVYRYFLFVYLDELALQLDARDNPQRPFTLAEDYLYYPSETNKNQLMQLFFSINQYFESKNYTWSRYIERYKFQTARRDLYVDDWQREWKTYCALLSQKEDSPGCRQALREARASADFTYARLKKEGDTNCLPYFSKVDAFYLSDTVDDYLKKVEEEARLEKQRKESGKRKEVVVFIHGLGESRRCWGEFPELLAREDVADPSLKQYYPVYVFQYATKEKSKGVDDFMGELAGFIDQIKAKEGVEKVTLIGHSFGGVLSLRYLTSRHRETGAPCRDNVGRFIGIAPSLHGSHMANLVVGMFGEKEKRFERDLPMFARGMPFVGDMGDLQIVQNQIGSNVNLESFRNLDRQQCLDLPGGGRIEALVIIGDPWNPLDLFAPGGRGEDDDLVKTFSANLNHIYLDGASAEKSIGYSGAAVRYTDLTHFPIIKAMNRDQISYRYVASFLKGKLLPQEKPREHNVKHFLVAVRVFPAYFRDPTRSFLPTAQRSPTDELILPALSATTSAAERVKLHSQQWNMATGVYFAEGHVEGSDIHGKVRVHLSADGYESKELALPVRAGQVTYAVGVSIKRD